MGSPLTGFIAAMSPVSRYTSPGYSRPRPVPHDHSRPVILRLTPLRIVNILSPYHREAHVPKATTTRRKKPKPAPVAEAPASPATITCFKGFDANWRCRGFQYEVGKTYYHDGPVKLCSSGFHACEAPLDCLNYYSIIDGNFAEVELGGVSDERESDTKCVGSSLRVNTKLSVAGLVNAQIDWCKKFADEKSISSGSYSRAASSGSYSTAASSGHASTAASSGHASTAASSVNDSEAASSGHPSTAASSGNYSRAACDTHGFACVAGVYGLVKGNAGSALSLGYRDAQGRNRIAVAYVGENGIEPDTWYKVEATGNFVKA